MKKITAGLLIVVGVIHLLPILGVLGADRLMMLYGVEIVDPNLEILMRHRAVLFGLLGLFMFYAAVKPSLQPLAILAGLISVLSFLVIAVIVGEFNDSIHKVFIVDIIALLALIAATILYVINRPKHHKP